MPIADPVENRPRETARFPVSHGLETLSAGVQGDGGLVMGFRVMGFRVMGFRVMG
jgi:hypothetical protein